MRRLPAALPLLTAFILAGLLYSIEAWTHRSPWIYLDELTYARISQEIANLGSGPGSVPFSFEGLYPFLTAPAWLFDNVHTAYAAAKEIGALTMATAVFPAYWLARTLRLSRPLALFAAVGTVAVPALSYSSVLMQETLAYPYGALCLFLLVRALATPSRGWIAGAAAASVLAPIVRKELVVIPLIALAATALFLATSPRRRALTAALLVVAAGLAAVVSTTWRSGLSHPVQMLEFARSGGASLAIGLGVLPAVAGLAALAEARSRAERAFVAVAGTSVVGFLLYAAAKGVYLGPDANPIEERNLIYLVPLLLAGTALWLSRGRARPVAALTAAALIAAIVSTLPLRFGGPPASDAPSLGILSELGLGPVGLNVLFALVAGASGLVVASLGLVRLRAAAVVVCALVLAWTLSSEIYASHDSAAYAKTLIAPLPRPLDWITHATHGAPTLYVGQEIVEPTDIWTLSFWNPSLQPLRSLDGTPASLFKTRGDWGILRIRPSPLNGLLSTDARIQYLLADIGVGVEGAQLAHRGRWTLYRPDRPKHLTYAWTGVYPDGWMGSNSTFTWYSGEGGRAVALTFSRKAWCGPDIPGRVFVITGSTRLALFAKTLHACHSVRFRFHPASLPLIARVRVQPTFVPHELVRSSPDPRHLGAVVMVRFG